MATTCFVIEVHRSRPPATTIWWVDKNRFVVLGTIKRRDGLGRRRVAHYVDHGESEPNRPGMAYLLSRLLQGTAIGADRSLTSLNIEPIRSRLGQTGLWHSFIGATVAKDRSAFSSASARTKRTSPARPRCLLRVRREGRHSWRRRPLGHVRRQQHAGDLFRQRTASRS
jgi:hypothetical protein